MQHWHCSYQRNHHRPSPTRCCGKLQPFQHICPHRMPVAIVAVYLLKAKQKWASKHISLFIPGYVSYWHLRLHLHLLGVGFCVSSCWGWLGNACSAQSSWAQIGAVDSAQFTWLCCTQDPFYCYRALWASSLRGDSSTPTGIPSRLTLRSTSHPLTFGLKCLLKPFYKSGPWWGWTFTVFCWLPPETICCIR